MNKISVLIPAFNEEKNIATVVNLVKNCSIVDEIIVIDNNSTDKTNEIASNLGVKTIFCENKGKGYAMEHGIKMAKTGIVLFIDADICNYDDLFIHKMVDPILNGGFDFVKASFDRDGGRVTELVAKPLLELTFPDLQHFEQPLSGIIAGRKHLFEQIEFEKDYGVDIGILIDMHKLNAKITQVNIGKIQNDSQDWKDLTHMARQVSKAILNRIKK